MTTVTCWRDLEASVGSLANHARHAHGVPLLAHHSHLAAAARAHAEDLLASGRFSHDGSDGSDVLLRVRRTGSGWLAVGENLAMGMARAGDALRGWLNSPPHRANLLHPGFTYAGAAVLPLPLRPGVLLGYLWVQVYGTPRPTGGLTWPTFPRPSRPQ